MKCGVGLIGRLYFPHAAELWLTRCGPIFVQLYLAITWLNEANDEHVRIS
jgi:hypothetical protein